MKKKLLIGLSSFGLVAGFWACGDGSVEPLNEETDGYVKAMLETQSIDFASQVADAKKNCAADVICENEMAKAQGSAIQIESSAAPTPESSDGNPQPVSSSSSRDFFNNFSSRGPIGQQSSSSVAPVVVESSSSEVNVPAGQFGTCFAGLSTAPKTSAELGESVTWTFKPNTAVIKTNELLKIMINWSFPNGTPDSYAGTQGKTTGLTSYSVSGTKTAVASVTSGGATQEVSCSPLRVNGQKIEGCKCMPTNIQPDVSKGESATWTASGCTSKANIIGYTWKGATADATGLVATAPVAAKDDEVAEAEEHVNGRADEKPRGHHLARRVPVGDNSVQKTSDSVDYAAGREKRAELDFRNPDLAKKRHGYGEVLPDHVIEGVSAHRHQQRLPLPPLQ